MSTDWTAAEVAQLTGLSVHSLNCWRQSGQGPKSIKAGTRTLYPRQEVRWLAEIDGHTESSLTTASAWFARAVEAARTDRIGTHRPGRMTLTSGKQVLITASLRQMTAGVQQFIDVAQSVGQALDGARGFAAGDGDGIPLFVDLAHHSP